MTRELCRGRVLFIDVLATCEATKAVKLRKAFEAAVDDHLLTREQGGKAPQRPFRGLFNLRVLLALHRGAAVRALDEGVTPEEVVVRALAACLGTDPAPVPPATAALRATRSPRRSAAVSRAPSARRQHLAQQRMREAPLGGDRVE